MASTSRSRSRSRSERKSKRRSRPGPEVRGAAAAAATANPWMREGTTPTPARECHYYAEIWATTRTRRSCGTPSRSSGELLMPTYLLDYMTKQPSRLRLRRNGRPAERRRGHRRAGREGHRQSRRQGAVRHPKGNGRTRCRPLDREPRAARTADHHRAGRRRPGTTAVVVVIAAGRPVVAGATARGRGRGVAPAPAPPPVSL